ncbi:E3 ubiquitin-protein ligase MIB2-like isoform X2 [Dreissena polymorpha]|uniref:E3 ubiquitin-protein ligase MIB2-like isoform X2 n=1 Tax=Dreissena polymorpha TaxID=45954 RepID=UPI0022653BB4|nr:E3 ubiquitin-protein ligase MIB2-like isoform X2 [Dreissena polymorpha]
MATGKSGRPADPQWPDWMKPGVRVIRGPDFRATVKNHDETNLGILSYVPKTVTNNRVHVVWDTGQERNYNSGFTGQYDLRAYDLQQVGISHKKKCSGCNSSPIRGMLFTCRDCKEDLCTVCYHGDKHNLDHTFYRLDSASSDIVPLPPRKNSQFLRLMGVTEKTEVIRGPHWNYTGADGETGRGIIKAFVDEKDGKYRAWVRVKWDVGKEMKEYRFGAEGYVDVIASKVVPIGKVYSDHLPFLGITKLKVGDKVTVNLTLEELNAIQAQANKDGKVPGGWDTKATQCLSETGSIVESLFNGESFRVQYLDGKEYVISKTALFRVCGFCEKDAVEIIPDKSKLKILQNGHGGMPAGMEMACGKLGRLIEIRKDGDMLVMVGGKQYTFNPSCCLPVTDPKVASKAPPMPSPDSDGDDNTKGEDESAKPAPEGDCVPGRRFISKPDEDKKENKNLKEFSDDFGNNMNNLKRNQDVTNHGNNMFEAIAKADLDAVLSYVIDNKKLLDYKVEGRTILHLACHEGYKSLITNFIELGANTCLKDDEGDTPLHYAAFGKQPDCVQELLQNAADPNVQNKNGVTPLMIAVDQSDLDSVQCLILNNANVSLKTTDGETAMHSAVEQKEGQPMLVSAILSSKSADFSICNHENFNVLQYAAYKNCPAAVRVILDSNKTLVDVPMGPDKYTALHVASINDFVEVSGLLLEKGGANPNALDSEQKTPLHLAVIRQHKRSIELLLNKDANVNAQDKDGNTPLHLSQNIPLLQSFRKSVAKAGDSNIAIVYALLEKGADLRLKNKLGQTPVDLIQDKGTKQMLEKLQQAYQTQPAQSQSGIRLPINWTKMQVNEVVKVNLNVTDSMEGQEYAEVEKHFMKTMPHVTIVSITRVQNAQLWEHYNLKKREMERKYGQGSANELHLYHGTKPDIIENIIHDNFDFRISGSRVGALYGDGSYFATTSKYSDLYSSVDQNGHKFMFVAKVLAGKTCMGQAGLKRPPQIDPNDFKKGYYDAVVNQVLAPTIYCVFDMNQYYPEYYIKYY